MSTDRDGILSPAYIADAHLKSCLKSNPHTNWCITCEQRVGHLYYSYIYTFTSTVFCHKGCSWAHLNKHFSFQLFWCILPPFLEMYCPIHVQCIIGMAFRVIYNSSAYSRLSYCGKGNRCVACLNNRISEHIDSCYTFYDMQRETRAD